MKLYLSLIVIVLTVSSCKNETKKTETKELTIAERIAKANGIDNWKNVDEIRFTFNVDRKDSHFERSWVWKPKTGDVTMITSADTVSYNRKSIDSLTTAADKSFINDKFWLLAPYNLVWDEGTTISNEGKGKTHLTDETLDKLTIVYGSEGGYTPGDAYDFFYDENFIIKEWVFRKGNQKEPSMITTWEDYEDFNGLKIAKSHLGKDNSVKLYFTNISVN